MQLPLPPAEKRDHGITVLFGKTHDAWISDIARRKKISKGEVVRRLVEYALRAYAQDN